MVACIQLVMGVLGRAHVDVCRIIAPLPTLCMCTCPSWERILHDVSKEARRKQTESVCCGICSGRRKALLDSWIEDHFDVL